MGVGDWSLRSPILTYDDQPHLQVMLDDLRTGDEGI